MLSTAFARQSKGEGMDERTIGRVPGVLEATVGEQRVLLAPNTLAYFALNGTGTAIWEAIPEAGITVDALVALMSAAFEVEDATCRPDIEEFLTRALDFGVLTEVAAE